MKASVKKDAKCQVCNGSLFAGTLFFDAKTARGSWGWLCQSCFHDQGCKLGVGLGQSYESKTLEKLDLPGPIARELTKVRLNGADFYLDTRLGELRQVDNPHNVIRL